MRQVARDRPLAEEQRGGDLPVRAALGDEGGDAALRRGQSLLARAPADPPELGARLRRPRSAAPSCSNPSSAAAIASRAARFCRSRRRTTPSASSARARPNGSPTASCCATACASRRERPRRRRRGRRRRDRGTASRARAPSRGRAASRPPPRRRGLAPRRRPAELEQRLDVVGAPPAACSARPSRAPAARLGLGEPLAAPAADRRSRARRVRGSPGAWAGGARTAPRQLAALARECSRASSSWPRWTAIDRDREVVLRHLEPVLDRDVVGAVGVARPRAPSARPRARPMRGPRARGRSDGSSRSRHSSYSRSSSARASLRCRERRRERGHDARRSPPAPVARRRGRSRGRAPALRDAGASRVADEPAEERPEHRRARDSQRVVVELVGELERRTCVLERSDEALPEAGRPRESAVDDRLERRARRRLAKRLLEQRDGTVEALELGEEDERLGAQRPDVCLGQQVGRDRPGARPLAGGVMGASCRERATVALVAIASGGVSRSACSASSAATADAPRSAASVAASSSTAATAASGVSRRRARGGGRGGAGPRRSPAITSVNAPSLARPGPGREPTTAAGG